MPLPRHIGPYRVIQAASHAGAGQVFLCLSSASQEVAVELLPGVPRERLARQAQALQRVQHPNVIRFVEVGEQPDGTPWLATEWLKVVTLEQRRRRHLASLPAAELVLKLLDALQAVHAAGLVHRELEPRRVLMRGAEPVLFGFGRAVQVERPGPCCDVPTLGRLLFALLAGCQPSALTAAVQRRMDREVAPRLGELCLSAMRADSGTPRDLTALQRDLAAWLHQVDRPAR